jgi:hypothetical protein
MSNIVPNGGGGEQSDPRPLMSFFLQPFPYSSASDEPSFGGVTTYSPEFKMSVTEEGMPVYCDTRYKSPPTLASTPGHTIPGGYTSTGKYKNPRSVPSKWDKRAGK